MNGPLLANSESLEDIVAEIADEFCHCLDCGEEPDIETFAQRRPEMADAIRQMLEALVTVRSMAPKVSAGAEETLEGSPPRGELGDFRILGEIGRGGMGVVYEAEQISLHRRVALKVLPLAAVLDQRRLQRFKNEAQAAASLKHPNIVGIHSVGCERGVHYYAMEYVDGRTLAQVIDQLREPADPDAEGPRDWKQAVSTAFGVPAAEPSPWQSDAVEPTDDYVVSRPPHDPQSPLAETKRQPESEASTEKSPRGRPFFRSVADLGIQAAEALEHAHQTGIVHRDIKPSNLMVDADGHLWITDFGLAMTQTETNFTMSGDILGTLRYMSPEQVEGNRRVLDH
ncbi:MAG: serine/threonine-protein kinase, partial [Planctomycetota bacterium]